MSLYLYNQDLFFLPKIKSKVKKFFKASSGPDAVFNSLCRGLNELGQDFKINAKITTPIQSACVISGPKSLKWAIEQKQKGKIKLLAAGPNVVQTPNDFSGLMAKAEVDACLVPSDQVLQAYERYNPKLRGRIFVWYTGINERFWSPQNPKVEAKNILFYCKNGPEELIKEAESVVSKLGFNVTFVNYGNYNHQTYKSCLEQSSAVVFFSQSESQGIALAEAWAMNVPTLVWDPKKPHPHFKEMIDSPAPFLSGATGKFWENLSELENLLVDLHSFNFTPRSWVLQNMTDKISAKLFLNILSKFDERTF